MFTKVGCSYSVRKAIPYGNIQNIGLPLTIGHPRPTLIVIQETIKTQSGK